MRRVGGLDGIRGLALVAVLAYHSAPTWAPGGWLGVDVFFVLSGYLLASILLRKHARTGRIGWQRYAIRRVRRLAPALVALVAGIVVLAPLVAASDAHRLPGDVLAAAAGVMNWHLIADHSSYFDSLGRPSLLRHAWSLSVEMQFYVVCPLLVAWLARRRPVTAIAAVTVGIAASAVAMGLQYSAADPSRAYYGTDARVGALLAGVLLALILANRAPARALAPLGMISALGLTVLFVTADDTSRLLYPAGFLAVELATVLLIAAVVRPGVLGRVFAGLPLRWLGERSYGIYLWHWPLVVVLRPGIDVTWPAVVTTAVTVAGAVVLGALSYAFVERPFLRPRVSRDWWVDSGRWALAGAALAGIGLLTAHLPRADPIVASIRAGQELVAAQPAATAQPATTAPPPVPTTTPAGPAPVVTPAARPVSARRPAAPKLAPGPPPGTVRVAAIGDSVMLGAARYLQARLGDTGFIDGDVSRQFGQAAGVVARLRSQGRLGEVVVIHLGTNGPPRSNEVDAVMRELADVDHVLFLTVRMPRKWEAQSNEMLRSIPGRYGNARVVDWHAYSDGHPEYFESDGVHLKARGGQAYADLVGSALPAPPPPPTTTTTPPETTTTVPPDTTTTVPPESTTTTTTAGLFG